MPVNKKDENNPVIYKYLLSRNPGAQAVVMPTDMGPAEVEILSFGLDPQRNLAIWAVVRPDNPRQARGIFLALTGAEPPPGEVRFIGTVNDDGYVIHCWDMGWR